MGRGIIGRERELETLRAFFEAGSPTLAALVLEGEAGIGKTTLWRAGVAAAADRGYRCLTAAGSPAEAQLTFSALGDLLDGVVDDVLPELPPPQRRALAVALLLEDANGRAPDQRAVGVALVGALRVLASDTPVLLAVDDVQWLDRPSRSVLEFALRRLQDERVAILVARRISGDEARPDELGGLLPEERVTRIRLGSFALGPLHRLLAARFGLALPRPLLVRLHEAAGGNPFLALELGRALRRRKQLPAPGEPLPVPSGHRQLLVGRIAELPPDAREAVLLAAALARPEFEVVTAALARPQAEDALETAFEAEVLERDDGRIRFSHPLFATAVYSEASPADRRRVHRQLAGVVRDQEERARHLALATEGADAEIAAALEEAARASRVRGAPDAAAELAEQARRLTPDDAPGDGWRRAVDAAQYHHQAGDNERARVLLEEVVASAPRGDTRARALNILWAFLMHEQGLAASEPLLERALTEAQDPALRAQISADLALSLYIRGDVAGASPYARAVVELAEELGRPALLADANAALATLELLRGRGLRTDLLERVDSLTDGLRPESAQDATYLMRAGARCALMLLYADRFDEARVSFEALHEHAIHDQNALPHVLGYLGLLEAWSGNWTSALRYADESEEAAVEAGLPILRDRALLLRAFVDAHLGRVDAARAAAEEALQLAERGNRLNEIRALGALGFLDLSLENVQEAAQHLNRAFEVEAASGFRDPGVTRFHGDYIEALVSAGELARAEEPLQWLEERGATLDRPSARASAARCRGLLLAARGAADPAFAAFERALREHERFPDPFERGRTLLALGAAERRAKQKRRARETLSQALAVFEGAGAELWTDKARAELARIGGRAPAGDELTLSERRIAKLVADGKTNKEVAAILVVADRTVESALTQVYRKLNVRSRTELARRLTPRA
jgi:DNA-binding CsgD family transcriptional regulator